MIDYDLISSILDSLKSAVVFADTQHIIRYMNRAAIERYRERGGEGLIGNSLLECHDERSQQVITEVLEAMQKGEEECLITDNEKHRAFMRAVRDPCGQLLGYYEHHEPSVKPSAAL